MFDFYFIQFIRRVAVFTVVRRCKVKVKKHKVLPIAKSINKIKVYKKVHHCAQT